MKKGILGSSSPARAQILKSLGLHFQVFPSAFPEESLQPSSNNPQEHPLNLTRAKMDSLLQYKNLRADYFVTADTLVFEGKRILGKPKDKAQAREWLLSYAGRELVVATGLVLLSWKGGEKISAELTKAHLIFGDYGEEVVDFYLALNPPWQVAGAFAWQSGAQILVRQLKGGASTVVGLPIFEFYAMLAEHGLIDHVNSSSGFYKAEK